MTAKNTKTKKSQFIRFFLVLLVVLAYIGFAIYRYGFSHGLSVTALTWAFFIFATPIADAGFLVAFPVRLLIGLRMLTSQIIVWVIGAVIVGGFLLFDPSSFHTTGITRLFYAVLTTPWPLWLILILSAVGTFLNIKFDDTLYDVAASKHKKSSLHSSAGRVGITIGIFAVTILLYVVLLRWTNIPISLV